MPFISIHMPGSGVTPFNVDDLSFRWWRVFRGAASQLAESMKREAKRG